MHTLRSNVKTFSFASLTLRELSTPKLFLQSSQPSTLTLSFGKLNEALLRKSSGVWPDKCMFQDTNMPCTHALLARLFLIKPNSNTGTCTV